ncbi:unnamed protein product [Phaeothamnion confervicola]
MEVAYWEIAPYLPNVAPADLEAGVTEYVRNNAGKAFEFMVEACDTDRKAAGLPDAESTRKARGEDPATLAVVDAHRNKFGLKTFTELRGPSGGEVPTLLQQQKEETVEALSKIARPCPGVPEVLAELRSSGIAFCISTTSPKPRVPASITACGLDEYFPAQKVHSGESDFNPPRFKPDPSVYLKASAAKAEKMAPCNCIAVEDSGSGVGSAANACIGFIVGYVGASHVPDEKAATHAEMLMSGSRSKDKRGADIVISDMRDLPKLVALFKESRAKGVKGPPAFSTELLESLKKPIWTRGNGHSQQNGH